MKLGKALKIGWSIACLCAAIVGFGAAYAAWQHNPQQEFHSATHVSWLELSLIWFSWFLVAATVLGGVASTCMIAAYKLFGLFRIRGT